MICHNGACKDKNQEPFPIGVMREVLSGWIPFVASTDTPMWAVVTWREVHEGDHVSLVHNHGIGKIGVETKFRIEKTKKYKDILNLLLWSKPWSGSHFMFRFLSERTHCSWTKRQHMMSSLSASTWRRPFYQLGVFGSAVILCLLAY